MKSGISLLNAKAKSTLGNDSDARMVLKNLLTIRNGRIYSEGKGAMKTHKDTDNFRHG
jgi:hypothetical protein